MSALDTSIGAILIGTCINTWLYGILVAQVTLYYTVYKHDQTWIKVMVACLMVLDTLNTVFDIGFVYRYTITLFGNFPALAHSHWFFHMEPLMTVMIASTTQGFFAWRINRLTGWTWVSWAIGFVLFVQFAAGLACTVGAFIVVDFARFEELRAPISLWLVTSAVADIAITSILTWYLHTHRTGFSRTDDLITRLIRVTVQTGLLTTVWAVADLIVFLAVPNPLHLVFNLPLCKLYTNSMMSTLNARGGWEMHLNSASMPGISIPSDMARDRTSGHQPSVTSRKVGIFRRSEVAEVDSFELKKYSKSQVQGLIDVERAESAMPVAKFDGPKSPSSGAVQLQLPVSVYTQSGQDLTTDESSLNSPSSRNIEK